MLMTLGELMAMMMLPKVRAQLMYCCFNPGPLLHYEAKSDKKGDMWQDYGESSVGGNDN